eukprot:TRINITY_DN25825_c0_g1_i1.p1 TRINITY_DN25825_c0_g1~~TRINITY_DN25825_c0_g1_i1.p1  ORF type:complete len:586 (+),score=154.07 TRINITY_DN25825_c0_g1_i1:172-1929(+)
MNNSDFKRLLVSDDKALVKELTQSRKKKDARPMPKGKGKGKGAEGPGKGAKGGGKGPSGGQPAGGQAPNQPEYRDRAAERREGKNEYESIAAEFEHQETVSVEQSKYLGGDLDHTHLVKGLDFALLAKMRTELNKQQRKDELQEQRLQKKTKKERNFTTGLAKNVWRAVVDTLHPHHKTFQDRLKGMAKALSLGQRIRNAPSIFLPGRMEYEFDVDPDAQSTADIPRIIYMSKDDAPSVDKSRRVSPVLAESVGRVRASMQRAIEERKRRKQEKMSGAGEASHVAQKVPVAVAKPKAKDLDDDIFAGAGGYDGAAEAAKAAKKKEEARAKARAAASSKSADASDRGERRASYFDDAGAEKYQEAPDDGQLNLEDVTVEEGQGGDVTGTSTKEFRASDKWRGSKPGWVFKLGDLGLGYYLDDPKLAARYSQSKASIASDSAAERKPLRNAKQTEKSTKRSEPAADDDAYGECFPSAMLGHALMNTGEAGSDEEEEDSAKKKIEKLKKLSEKGSVETSAYGKKGKDQADAKKRKLSENQEWQKIDSMIKKGKHGSFSDLERAQSSMRTPGTHQPPSRREVFSTPAYF